MEIPAPQEYRPRTITAVIGEQITIPYHSTGITIKRMNPFEDTVEVSFLEPAEDPVDDGNIMAVHEYDMIGETVALPYNIVGTTTNREDDGDTSVFYLQ